MGRFNDKDAIVTIDGADIIPCTDLSDATDDKKVTFTQIGEFTATNIETLSGGLVLSENNLTDALKIAYDGAVTYSHTHTNKDLLDDIIDSGNGDLFLADDGTYKDPVVKTITRTGTSDTGSATAEKAVTLANFVLETGATIFVTFTNENTATTPTLNVNSTGAKSIASQDGTVADANYPFYVKAGVTVQFTYDGTNWVYENKVVKSYVNGTSWYNIWANGFIEQGGILPAIDSDAYATITLLLSMQNTNYSVLLTGAYSATTGNFHASPVIRTRYKTTTNFVLVQDTYSTDADGSWIARGY